MFRHDVSHWPLVVSIASGPQDATAARTFIDSWNDWLSWNEPFATLRVFTDPLALQPRPEFLALVEDWLAARRDAFRRNLMGIANIVPASQYEHAQRVKLGEGFAAPARTFTDLDAGLHWLAAEIFGPRELPLDRDAVSAVIASAA